MTLDDLRAFTDVPVDPKDPRYLQPLQRDAELLRRVIGPRCQVVFLGSIGTKKYAEVLLPFFEERLLFPPDFVGRGDMSRGGLLLRSAAEERELEYVPLAGAIRHGKRPAKLVPRSWGYRTLSGREFIESRASETGAWRGEIEGREVRPTQSTTSSRSTTSKASRTTTGQTRGRPRRPKSSKF